MTIANTANISRMRATMIDDGCQSSAKIVLFSEKRHDNQKKLVIQGLKMFNIRDFVFKMREITDFKHQKTVIQHGLEKFVVLLHQKKILMVKVYG